MEQQKKVKTYQVDGTVFNAMFNYIVSRPFQEVVGLITALDKPGVLVPTFEESTTPPTPKIELVEPPKQ